MPVSHCISSFEDTFYKKLQGKATSSFIYFCFISAFTSADFRFYNFLELLQSGIFTIFIKFWNTQRQ